jgi:predicted SnoaL-like aldol condensation-catalyzing enzyme
MNNSTLVINATSALFGQRDLTAIDRYWSSNYRQHSALAADGPDALRKLAANLSTEFSYVLHRVFAQGDLVVTHGTYVGFGPDPLVAFDLWRVTDGKITEHWDALQPFVAVTASGHSQTDGPNQVELPTQTASSQALVERFVQTILIDGDFSQLASFYDGDAYIQHNPLIPDLVSGLGATLEALGKQGITMSYAKRHRTVAEGEFVFTQSEGTFGGKPHAFYDLFRVENGFIAEHWDVMVEQANDLQHSNGLF